MFSQKITEKSTIWCASDSIYDYCAEQIDGHPISRKSRYMYTVSQKKTGGVEFWQ